MSVYQRQRIQRRRAHRVVDDSPLTPQAGSVEPAVVTLQHTIGNRAVQRAVAGQPVPAAQHITTAPRGMQRTIQRNVFHSMLRGFARKNIFGKNKDRRRIREDTASVKQKTHFFSDVKDVTVKNGPHNLAGRYYKGLKGGRGVDLKYAGKTVLFLSGSGGSAEDYGLDLAKFYCARGADFVAVNYRGFGGSTKDTKNIFGQDKQTQIDNSEITEQGVYSDAHAIFAWLMGEGVSPDSTFIHGFSLGGPVAAELTASLAARGYRVAGLILESPMDSVREQAKQAAPTRGIGAFMANAGGVVMDLRTHLQTLAGIEGFRNLAIHFMSGTDQSGDQLGLDVTGVDKDAAKMGFTNVRATIAQGADHEDVKSHIEVAERGSNRLAGDPTQSLDRLFETAAAKIESDAKPPVPSSDPKVDVLVDSMMQVLGEDLQQELAKEAEDSSKDEQNNL
jgi:pimeloyl-ACP methyl ester carboxylesterase